MARAYVKVCRRNRRDREEVLVTEMSVFDNYGRRITASWVKRFIKRNWPKEGWWVSIAGKSDKDCFTVIRPIENGWERMYFYRI